MPGQSPMPGQAQGIQQVMPGMQRQGPQPGTPPAMVAPLTKLHLDQLMQLMLNPRPDGPPLYAVISAITKQQEQAQARADVQRQMAMAQGQQAAQQPPIAQQVLAQAQQMQQPQQEPVMAAYGGEMRGYASGGAVAFDRAGAVLPREPGETFEEYRQRMIRHQDEQRAIEVAKKRARDEAERIAELQKRGGPRPSPFLDPGRRAVDTSNLFPFGPPESPMMDVPEIQIASEPTSSAPASRQATTFDITNPASINALRIAAQDTSLPEAERAALSQRIAMMEGNRPSQSGVVSLAKPQATLTPEEEQYFANKASTLRTRQGVPEDVLAGRQGIASLAAENLAAQRAEREQMAREAKEQRDAALARAQRGILDDPQALLALAGSIDTRRGKGLGSLARGAAGIMGGKETAAEAARKEYALSQRDQRMLQANERQANMLEMQRQQAILENNVPRVSQIEDQLAALEMQKSQLLRSRQEHAEKIGLEERRVGAMEADAAAKLGRPTEIDFFRQDPEGYGRFQAARRGPQTAGERQDLAELNALIASLKDQADITKNYDKASREQASVLLKRAQARLAQMSGIDGAPMPTGGAVRPSSQAEFDALPKGARYINPADGKEYTKN